MALSSEVVSQLKEIFSSEELYTDTADCWPYGYDNSKLHHPPDVVVIPHSHEQILQCVKICNQHKIPLTTRGRGTGTTGASIPVSGGIVLSTERMTEILDFNPGNRSVRVQVGITNLALQNFLAEKGFFWPPDPSSAEFCTVGGNLACNAAGPRAVKYGTTRDNTLQLKVITGDGKTIITGSKTSKGVVGLDLTRLLIGSEGTLGIITEAELKIQPVTPLKNTLRVLFASHQNACDAIQRLLAQPHIPCAIEFMDHHAIQLIKTYGNIELAEDAKAMLMIEIDGDENSLPNSRLNIENTLHEGNLVEMQCATTQEEMKSLWQARKALSPILRTLAPNKINEDVVVPVPNLSKLIDKLDELSEKYSIPIVNFGHAGNGNLHVNILYDQNDQQQNKNAPLCLEEIFAEVINLEGTLSGEHGIGILKRDHIDKELGHDEINLMRNIKALFDPNLILNPNKSLPSK